MARNAKEYNEDTYELRLVMINQYISRLKWVMAGTVGLLFFVSSDLINSLEKAILVTLVFLNIGLGYFSLMGFEEKKTDVEYKLNGEPKWKTKIVAKNSWPVNCDNVFQISFYLFLILACLVFAFMWIQILTGFAHHEPLRFHCS